MDSAIYQVNDFLKKVKIDYSKMIPQSKRILFLLDEKNFLPKLSVRMDTGKVEEIFKILIANSCQYTDKGYIKIGYHVLDNGLQFFVEDTGVGIGQENLEKINEYFSEEVSSSEKSNNLKAVNSLVRAMGGKALVESQENMGTTVYFSIASRPVNVDDSSNKPVEASSTKNDGQDQSQSESLLNNVWKGKTILIAEDEIVNYMFLEVLLEDTGVSLIHATDGAIAIEKVKENPNIDLVLMDIKMPNINGLDATRQIKSMRPQLPVIAQTAYAMQDDEYKALQAGCNDYISKPIDANKLISLMKKYLR